jgi:hypothetical protein
MIEALEQLYAARATARARLDYATQAVERAQRIETDALARVDTLTVQVATAESEQATALACQIAQGGPSSELPTPMDEGLVSALALAKSDLSIKHRALASLQSAQAEGQTALAVAERAVISAVDEYLAAEIIARAKQVADLLDQATLLGTALKYFAVACGLHSTAAVAPSTLAVLDRLNVPLLNALHVPIHLEKLGDAAEFAAWTARREQMIDGDGDGETEPKAA